MKKIIILSFCIVSLIFVSCNSKEEQRLREQHIKDSFNTLLQASQQDAQTLNAQLENIDANLMEITSQYAELRKVAEFDGNINEDKAIRISKQINAIADVLAKDKNRLAAIQYQLSKQQKNDNKTIELQNKINELTAKIAEEESQIATLTNDLKNKNIQLDNLNQQVTKLQEESKKNQAELTKLEDERYAGYFIVGTKKELKKAGLITSQGGFIGIGKTTMMINNGDISTMQKIDIRTVKEIPLTGQKIEILTSHPYSAYSLEGNINKPSSIVISSPSEFWQASRCLVILVK